MAVPGGTKPTSTGPRETNQHRARQSGRGPALSRLPIAGLFGTPSGRTLPPMLRQDIVPGPHGLRLTPEPRFRPTASPETCFRPWSLAGSDPSLLTRTDDFTDSFAGVFLFKPEPWFRFCFQYPLGPNGSRSTFSSFFTGPSLGTLLQPEGNNPFFSGPDHGAKSVPLFGVGLFMDTPCAKIWNLSQ